MSAVMDRPLHKPWWRKKQLIRTAIGVAALSLIASFYIAFLASSERRGNISVASITISKVEQGIFRDLIPLRTEVVPRDTIYLDASEGGRVEKVLIEAGDTVSFNQPLVILSNTELELSVREREARLIDSITQLQTYQTQLEQNRLNNDKALEQIDYNIVRLRRSAERHQILAAKGLEPREVLDNVEDELNYTLKIRPLQAQSNQQQNELRTQQMPQIRAQIKKLQENVEVTHSKLETLTVRAPIAGRITAIDLKVGENRNRGDRLAEITPDTGYKLSADIDEFYLNRLKVGQPGSIEIGESNSTVEIIRVYPQVKDGTFKIDLAFGRDIPDGLLPGQALQGKLSLGKDAPGVILASGAFLENTGGDWVFVLDKSGKSASRRRIKLGRRNTYQVEIINGLHPGDQVITSDYRGLERLDRLELTN